MHGFLHTWYSHRVAQTQKRAHLVQQDHVSVGQLARGLVDCARLARRGQLATQVARVGDDDHAVQDHARLQLRVGPQRAYHGPRVRQAWRARGPQQTSMLRCPGQRTHAGSAASGPDTPAPGLSPPGTLTSRSKCT